MKMTFLGTRKRHYVFWSLVTLCFLLTKFSTFSNLRLSLDSIFSGLLALTGFVFTARTFITFKLNEVIYGNPQYRAYVKKLQKEGAYDKELYAPLKNIDDNLGTATYMCFWATILAIIVAFLPKPNGISIGDAHIDFIFQLITATPLNTSADTLQALIALLFKAITDAVMIYFGFCLWQMVLTSKSLHHNIGDIIKHWEADFKSGDEKTTPGT